VCGVPYHGNGSFGVDTSLIEAELGGKYIIIHI